MDATGSQRLEEKEGNIKIIHTTHDMAKSYITTEK